MDWGQGAWFWLEGMFLKRIHPKRGPYKTGFRPNDRDLAVRMLDFVRATACGHRGSAKLSPPAECFKIGRSMRRGSFQTWVPEHVPNRVT